MKITEMKGSSLLPVRKEVKPSMNQYVHDVSIGFNSAVTQLEQCSVEVDCEELVNLIVNELPLKASFNDLQKQHNLNARWNKAFSIAKELSKCKQNWIRLEVGR